MGDIKINIANVITISLVAFVAVWLFNKALAKFGLGGYTA